MSSIQIEQYCKSIRGRVILDNINLEFQSGKIYGLQGVNGSGKTMLLRAISGLIHPSSGMIRINGEILGKDISFPRSIGMLIETPAFLDHFTGYKNLQLLGSLKRIACDQDIRDSLQGVGLDPEDL